MCSKLGFVKFKYEPYCKAKRNIENTVGGWGGGTEVEMPALSAWCVNSGFDSSFSLQMHRCFLKSCYFFVPADDIL